MSFETAKIVKREAYVVGDMAFTALYKAQKFLMKKRYMALTMRAPRDGQLHVGDVNALAEFLVENTDRVKAIIALGAVADEDIECR